MRQDNAISGIAKEMGKTFSPLLDISVAKSGQVIGSFLLPIT